MAPVLKRCLIAGQAAASDLAAVRKADYPTRDDFDAALEELAEQMQERGERFHKAYARAFESPDGQLLYAARAWAAAAPEVAAKREAVALSKAEEAIADAVATYVKAHPGTSREKALLQVLEQRPELYRAYEREKAAETRF